jgi:hypothetical protein
MSTISRVNFFALVLGVLALCHLGASCEDNGDSNSDGPSCSEFEGGAIWSCYYDTDITMDDVMRKGCFQYDESVAEEEAAAECATHQIGGQQPMAYNQTLKNCPCLLDQVSGYCIVDVDCGAPSCPTLPGKEWTQHLDDFLDNPYVDCDATEDTPIGAGEGCGWAAGTYTCYYNEDGTVIEEYADGEGNLEQPLP